MTIPFIVCDFLSYIESSELILKSMIANLIS